MIKVCNEKKEKRKEKKIVVCGRKSDLNPSDRLVGDSRAIDNRSGTPKQKIHE